jgi:hypothetical protein
LTLAYCCEGCSVPFVFLIARDGWRFRLEGQSHKTIVRVPECVSGPERSLFAMSMQAVESGNVPLGITLLRIFIEHYCRKLSQPDGKHIHDIISECDQIAVPAWSKHRTPSLYYWYEKLGEALLDSSTGGERIFVDACLNLEWCLDIRQTFGIPNRDTGIR